MFHSVMKQIVVLSYSKSSLKVASIYVIPQGSEMLSRKILGAKTEAIEIVVCSMTVI